MLNSHGFVTCSVETLQDMVAGCSITMNQKCKQYVFKKNESLKQHVALTHPSVCSDAFRSRPIGDRRRTPTKTETSDLRDPSAPTCAPPISPPGGAAHEGPAGCDATWNEADDREALEQGKHWGGSTALGRVDTDVDKEMTEKPHRM